ncbi:hypothetical protein BSKO_12964 [Bryopsis sp. KO-2023]|nr:hypothetical protein BSKO_12964 [Bryopsis sp. KO-2023]
MMANLRVAGTPCPKHAFQRSFQSRVCQTTIRGRAHFRISANLANLQSWQVAKLQDAYIKGRKKFKVKELCDAVDLPRDVVFDWMKDFDELDESTRKNVLETRAASRAAAQERREYLAVEKDKIVEDDVTLDWKSYISPRARIASKMMNKPLSKSALATMEKVYESIKYPDEDVIRDIFELHRIPRERVIKWFHKKRDKETKKRNRTLKSKRRKQETVENHEDPHMGV